MAKIIVLIVHKFIFDEGGGISVFKKLNFGVLEDISVFKRLVSL